MIPAGVTNIPWNPFGGCTSLTNIAVDPRNPAYSSQDGLLFNKSQEKLLHCPGGKSGDFVMPDFVSTINEGALFGCAKLTSLVIGRRVPVVGSVTMDYIMLDLGDVEKAEVGDEVTLIGEGIRVEELARKAGTIPYELTCRLGRRVGRIPANAEQPLPAQFRVVA
jgi:hypothetical protein